MKFSEIEGGDRVTIRVPNGIGRQGQEWKPAAGKAVFRGPAGWVLNMGGPHGTPGIATEENFISARKAGTRSQKRAAQILSSRIS